MAYKIIYRGEPSVGDESALRVDVAQVAHDEETGATYLQSRVRNAGETPVDGIDVTFSVRREDGSTHEVAAHQEGQLAPGSTIDLPPVKLEFADVLGVEAKATAVPVAAPKPATPVMPPLGELPVQPVPAGDAPAEPAPVSQPAAPAEPEVSAQPASPVPGQLPVAPGVGFAPASQPETPATQPAGAPGMSPAPSAVPAADPAPATAPGMPAAPVPGSSADAQAAQPKKKGSKGIIIAVVAIVAVIAIVALGFSSCSGGGGGSDNSIGNGLSSSTVENDPVFESDPDPVVGHWGLAGLEVDGEMYVEGNNASFDTSENYIEIHDDGTLDLMLDGELSDGTWELEEEMQDEQDEAEGLTYYSMTLLDAPFIAMVDAGDEPNTLVAMATDMEGYSMYLVRE